MTLEEKVSEYNKYRDSEKQVVEFDSYIYKYCWDVECIEGHLSFKTWTKVSGNPNVSSVKVTTVSLMPAAAASYTLITTNKQKNFKTYKQYKKI